MADVISPTSIGWPEGEEPIKTRRREREELNQLLNERPRGSEARRLHQEKVRAYMEERRRRYEELARRMKDVPPPWKASRRAK